MKINRGYKESGPVYRIKDEKQAKPNININIYISRLGVLGETLIHFVIGMLRKASKKK